MPMPTVTFLYSQVESPQMKSVQAQNEDSQRTSARYKEELAHALQKVNQVETELLYARRQHEDELDRLDRELRRTHADMAEVVLENRRLKAQSGVVYSDSTQRSSDCDLYSKRVVASSVRPRVFASEPYRPPPPGPRHAIEDAPRRYFNSRDYDCVLIIRECLFQA